METASRGTGPADLGRPNALLHADATDNVIEGLTLAVAIFGASRCARMAFIYAWVLMTPYRRKDRSPRPCQRVWSRLLRSRTAARKSGTSSSRALPRHSRGCHNVLRLKRQNVGVVRGRWLNAARGPMHDVGDRINRGLTHQYPS
jgi:hypothetical protein